MEKIKAVVLDIDGVIVGEKIGFNSPDPHQDVVVALEHIQNSGIPIILCTAKPNFAIKKIIVDAHLDNFHITDGGGVLIDPLNQKVLQSHVISPKIVTKIVEKLLENDVYTELYTTSEYVVQSSQVCDITNGHEHVLQTPVRQVVSLLAEIDKLNCTKIMPVARDLDHKKIVDSLLQQFIPDVVISWGVHPVILPLQFGIVTAPGISKSVAASEIIRTLKIEMKNVLGVGDSASDWQFIEPCGFGVAMGNAQPELKELVQSKGDAGYIAPSVDENGVLLAFRHFELIS